MDQNLDAGEMALDLVRTSFKKLGIESYLEVDGPMIRVKTLPGQSFAMTIVDDGIEATIFADEASWHTHCSSPDSAHSIFMDLLSGVLEIETCMKGSSFHSAVIREQGGEWQGESIRVLFSNPFKKTTSRIFRNAVDLDA